MENFWNEENQLGVKGQEHEWQGGSIERNTSGGEILFSWIFCSWFFVWVVFLWVGFGLGFVFFYLVGGFFRLFFFVCVFFVFFFYLYILFICFPLFFWKLEVCNSSLEAKMQTQTIQYCQCKIKFSDLWTLCLPRLLQPLALLCPICPSATFQSVSGQYFVQVHEILSIYFFLFFSKYQASNLSAPLNTNSQVLPPPHPFSSFFFFPLAIKKSKI